MLQHCAGELHKRTGALAALDIQNPAYSERLNSVLRAHQDCTDILEQLTLHDREAHNQSKETP
jgi:hypothetical protein